MTAASTSPGTDQSGSPHESTREPAREGERIVALDFVRGIAVMGILVANIAAFGQPRAAGIWPGGFLVPGGDPGNWLWMAQFVLIDGKMRGLFTILFGAGMILFLERAWARGSGNWLQVKRLIWLALFGLLHFYLVWFGDILFSYAVAGLILLPFARLAAKTQLALALTGYAVGALYYLAVMIPGYVVMETAFAKGPQFAEVRAEFVQQQAVESADGQAQYRAISSGDYSDFVEHQLVDHGSDPVANLVFNFPETLPLILLGMALYKLGFFSGGLDPGRQRFWGWAGTVGGGLALVAIALWIKSAGLTFYANIAGSIGMTPIPRLMMVLGLAALFSLYGARATGWLGRRIAAAGRAAFTNYLGTSIIMLAVFHGWALGLFGQLNRPQLYGIVLLVWAVMLLWSKPWLDHFRFGPLEWLWRCLTYGRMFRLRR